MRKKIRKFSTIVLCLLMVVAVFAVVPVNVSALYQGSIWISEDGTLSNVNAPISVDGNVYTLTDDVNGEIVIYKTEIILDGGGHDIGAGIDIEYDLSVHDPGEVFDVTIRNCGLIGGLYGVDIDEGLTGYITIENNTIDAWSYSILVSGCNVGIFQVINITSNTILHGTLRVGGEITNAIITGNTIISGNTIKGSSAGSAISVNGPCESCTISGNTFSGSGIGTAISCDADNIIIDDNMISNYENGISVEGITNIVTNNVIHDNNVGIKLQDSNNNQVWNNDFVDNNVQAQDLNGVNLFNLPIPIGGNHWNDYDGEDRGDGFGNTPYTFFVGQDNLPLVNSFKWTPLGPDVTVHPDPDVSVTFSNVLVEGITTVTTSSEIPGEDVNFLKFGDIYYDITTTAVFDFPVTVRLYVENPGIAELIHWYDSSDPPDGILDRNPVIPLTIGPDYVEGQVYSLSWFCIAYPVTPVEIDIKPGSDPNSINLGAKGNVPVGILTTSEFDATTVDPGTVTLAGASVGLKGKSDKLMASIKDVNGDDVDDLLVHIDIEELALIEGSTIATLHGTTYEGEEVKGIDSVNIVPP